MQKCVRFNPHQQLSHINIRLPATALIQTNYPTQANVDQTVLGIISPPSCGLLDVELEVALKPGSVVIVVQQLLKKITILISVLLGQSF